MLLPPDVEAHLDERLDGVRPALPELRWVPSSRWHITLEFLGECGRHEADRQLTRWSERASQNSPVELAVAGAGAFPQSWRARVVWAGVAIDPTAWRRLAGGDQEPHLTVARARESRNLTGLVDSLSTYSGPSWRVDQIALIASHLRASGERGPRYEPLESLVLGGGGGDDDG